MACVLGVDLGTSSVKVALYDLAAGVLRASAAHEYPILKPQPNYAEQDAESWWQATRSAIRRVLAQAGDHSPLLGIGLSGQMHGALLLDAQGQPLAPAIIWPDQRSAAQAQQLMDAVGRERYVSITGTLAATGFMAASLLWLKEHAPDVLACAHTVLLPKDYVRFRLCGALHTDVSDAAGTGLLDIHARRWSEDILQAAGLPVHVLPPLAESAAIVGQLSAQAADDLGLPAGLLIAAGSADQVAQAVGNGLVTPGRASVTIGSGGQVFVPVPAQPAATDPRLHRFNHAVPGLHYILGATLSAGLSLRWLRQVVGLEHHPDAYAILSAEAAQKPPGADGLIFLPYLTGERTPYMDSAARGAFIGLNAYHGRGHLARAVMEGVTFSLRQALELALELGQVQAEGLLIAGGASESPFWRQLMADVWGMPVQKSLSPEPAAVGASLLAALGAGYYASFAQMAQATARYDAWTEPRAESRALYDERYAHFCALYPRLREDLHRLA
ncbi:MAG: xylulokinase [Anaerolineae bacterium]|nr:xylulokinase [Anaerolineae bacterium]MDW8171298.1 xylulokinase [Anaerolineae bacterium]